MKKLTQIVYFIVLILVVTSNTNAQLPNGSIAPNWTLTDINGNTWTLYDILNQGKPVIIDFSATWCMPCYNYHNTHALETLYENYGPQGTDEIMVFLIEADLNTNIECLYGLQACAGNTTGNWVEGTEYPIINLTTNSVASEYNVSYYPTIYAISPDKRTWEIGSAPIARLESWIFHSFKMEVDGTAGNAVCPNSGFVNLEVNNGYSYKFYNWSNGATTQDLYGLNAGTYEVLVADSNGYNLTKSFTINGPPVVMNISNYALSNVTCNGNNNGGISIIPEGGNGGFIYEWSNGSHSSSIDGLEPGTYSVVVTDNEGCTLTDSYTIEEPDPLESFAFVSPTACNQNNGSVLLTAQGGDYNYLFQLLNNPASQNSYFTNLAAGSYQYTVSDGHGCITTSEFTIASIGSPIAQTSTSTQLSCSETQVSISGEGSTVGTNINYIWTTSNGTIVSGANSINATVSAPGLYTLVVINSSTACSSSSSITVTQVNNAPIANAGLPTKLTCTAPTAMLNASVSSIGPNFTYIWSTSNGNIVSGSNSIMPIVDKAGTYNLSVLDTTNNCVSDASVIVTEDKLSPPIIVSNGVLTCTYPFSEICAATTGGSNIAWTVNGNTVVTNCIIVTSAGSYLATATNPTNGCSVSANSIVSNAADLPQISATIPAPLTCLVTETTIEGAIIGNISDYTISWSTNNGHIVSGGNTLTPIVDQAGEYVMTAVKKVSKCKSSLIVNVIANINNPIAQFSHETINGLMTLTSTSPSSNGTVSWTINGQSAQGNNATVSFPTSGIYKVCMTYANECGSHTYCEDIAYYTTISMSGTTINPKCNGGTGSIVLNVTGEFTPPLTYAWFGPNSFVSSEESILGLSAGTYICVIKDGAGYTASETFIVSEPAALTAIPKIVNATNSQGNGSIELNLAGGVGEVLVTWSNGGTGKSIFDLTPGSYSATIVDENGCSREFGPFVIESINAVADPSFVDYLSIYPNPTSNVLNVSLILDNTYDLSLKIYNVQGQLIHSKDYNCHLLNQNIDVSYFNPGLYFFEILTEKGIARRKFNISR